MSQVFVCDVCDERAREALRFQVPTGAFSPDPAGAPRIEDYLTVDLCHSCAVLVLKQVPSPHVSKAIDQLVGSRLRVAKQGS